MKLKVMNLKVGDIVELNRSLVWLTETYAKWGNRRLTVSKVLAGYVNLAEDPRGVWRTDSFKLLQDCEAIIL